MPQRYLAEEVGDGGIFRISLHRPEKLNAISSQVLGELDQALARAEADASIHAVLVSGEGGKAFAAGADIAELAAQSPLQAYELSLLGQRVFRRLETLGKPSLAAIDGYALGGGLELALACTFRVAAENARLGMPEARLGIVPGFGGVTRLVRLIGEGRALELLLSGKPIDAAEAQRIGLVHHVVAPEALREFSEQFLKGILESSPLAVRLILEAARAAWDAGRERGLGLEAALFGQIAASRDRREGLAAFLEKRKPVFVGK